MVESWEAIVVERLSRRGDAMTEDIRQAFARALAGGAAAWPEVALPADTFVRHLLARWDGRSPLTAHVSALHIGDLYLAAACHAGETRALIAFTQQHLTQVPALLSRMHLSEAFAADVRQTMAEKLFVGPTPKITEYSGRGPLGHWIRVVALRSAVDLSRRSERVPALEQLPDAGGDPELAYLQARYRLQFRKAFEAAVANLSSDQRDLLRLHFVESISFEELARRIGVHRMTVLRRVKAARQAILEAARRWFHDQLGVSDSEYGSLFKLLRTQLELSIAPLLARPRPKP
jgi:RNA polymerase sigma-70 factor (ECF subfamily)